MTDVQQLPWLIDEGLTQSRGRAPPRVIGHGAARWEGIFGVRNIRAGQSVTETTVLG